MTYKGSNWLFWSEVEKDNFLKFPDDGHVYGTCSLLDKVMYPMMKMVANLVPDTVAPNVLTAAGLVCLMHAAYLAEKHSEAHPMATNILCSILCFSYYILDAVDGMHATRIRNTSNIGALMVTCVNAFAPVLLTIVLCRSVLGIQDHLPIWYAVQAAQLFFLFVQMRDLHGTSRNLVRTFIPGPAALVPLLPVLCYARTWVEYFSVDLTNLLSKLWWDWVQIVVVNLEGLPMFEHMDQSIQEIAVDVETLAKKQTWRDCFVALNAMMMFFVVIACLKRPSEVIQKNGINPAVASQTQTRLLICLAYKMVPSMMMNYGMIRPEEVTIWAVLVDGLFLTVLTADVVVSKMASRALHPWVILFCMVSVLDLFVETLMCSFYFFSVFYDLSEHSKIDLFTVQKNVYVDGIYDLCHIGHMRMFAESARFGNALLVGVVNDEDATPYKRKPIMTHDERCVEVAACKYVTKVIPNAPCDGLSREFLLKHNIHVVVCGEEYFLNPNDKYYKVPREMGILAAAPRTGGMSTSELINRVVEVAQDPDALAAKDKLRGESLVSE
eukprot:Rhum_TRINITY_DN16593_c0_g1::Rhum_TRINITY_DN16593_c0_g1_i1::g.163762::m.163762